MLLVSFMKEDAGFYFCFRNKFRNLLGILFAEGLKSEK